MYMYKAKKTKFVGLVILQSLFFFSIEIQPLMFFSFILNKFKPEAFIWSTKKVFETKKII